MNAKKHSLTLAGRATLTVSAVDDVISFDETLISLSVCGEILNISGNGLSIKSLSLENGDITVNGNVSAMVYFDNTPKKKGFSLFKG